MLKEDYMDATTLRRYVASLPEFQRRAYLENNPEFSWRDGDLTHAQWVRYGQLRARRGTAKAREFASLVRKAAWKPSHAPGVETNLGATIFTILFFACAGIAGVAGALYLYLYGA